MWSISDLFPSWGDTGTKPSDGTDRQGGDQISDEEYDYLWYAANQLEVDTRAALNDLDSNADGIVDKADSGAAGFSFDGAATLGGDVSDGSGNTLWNNTGKYVPADSVEQGPNSGLDADSVDGNEPPFASSISDDGTEVVAVPLDINFGTNIDVVDDGDQTATVSADDDATSYKGNDIDSNGDGKVNAAETADSADTSSLYKGNDIDTNGDGKVDAAENADTVSGESPPFNKSLVIDIVDVTSGYSNTVSFKDGFLSTVRFDVDSGDGTNSMSITINYSDGTNKTLSTSAGNTNIYEAYELNKNDTYITSIDLSASANNPNTVGDLRVVGFGKE